jgi:DNA-directed RNA polymerase subunit RPC12/RpoP
LLQSNQNDHYERRIRVCLTSIDGATIAFPICHQDNNGDFGMTLSNNSIHCPLCNTKHVVGLGLVIYSQAALVEYRCRHCGEIFFRTDQRGQVPAQLSEGQLSEGTLGPTDSVLDDDPPATSALKIAAGSRY